MIKRTQTIKINLVFSDVELWETWKIICKEVGKREGIKRKHGKEAAEILRKGLVREMKILKGKK